MNQNPEQPQQNNYTQYPQYEPTQAAPPPYDPTQLAPPAYPGNQGYPSPSYPPPSGNSSPDYLQQSPYSPQSPYPTPSGQQNMGGGYSTPNPYAPPVGTPQYPGYQSAPKKSRTWLWVTLGIAGVLLVALIASCAVFSNAIITNLAHTTSSTDATPTTTGGSGGDSGQVRTLQNVNCTMSQVRVIPNDDYAQAKAGTQFVQIHVKIDNTSSAKQHYNPLDFKLLTSDGKPPTTHTYIVPNGYDNQLSFGDLSPGQSIEGNLVFEVPTDDHGAMISWEPLFNSFADNPGQARWKLGL